MHWLNFFFFWKRKSFPERFSELSKEWITTNVLNEGNSTHLITFFVNSTEDGNKIQSATKPLPWSLKKKDSYTDALSHWEKPTPRRPHNRGKVFSHSQFCLYFVCRFLAGNALVLFVVARHRKMRTVTNFFLANLAAADLCVGIFCVLPNLSVYLSPYWVLGKVSGSCFLSGERNRALGPDPPPSHLPRKEMCGFSIKWPKCDLTHTHTHTHNDFRPVIENIQNLRLLRGVAEEAILQILYVLLHILRYQTTVFDTFWQYFGELLLVTPDWRTFFLGSFWYRRIS